MDIELILLTFYFCLHTGWPLKIRQFSKIRGSLISYLGFLKRDHWRAVHSEFFQLFSPHFSKVLTGITIKTETRCLNFRILQNITVYWNYSLNHFLFQILIVWRFYWKKIRSRTLEVKLHWIQVQWPYGYGILHMIQSFRKIASSTS